jgi:glycerol uptake facilitator-like aquaporin
MTITLPKRLGAEFIGTAFLLAIVVGSGIMAERLSGGNVALALLANAIATGAGLAVLILIFGPVSGCHINPAVTLAFMLRREIAAGKGLAYIGVQVIGALCGVLAAHAMFEVSPLLVTGTQARTGMGQWVGEGIATLGLLMTIFGCLRFRAEAVPYAVGLYITAGYWFTSSTSFANPAVSIARMFTNTFTGIRPADVAPFIAAQLCAAIAAVALANWIFAREAAAEKSF